MLTRYARAAGIAPVMLAMAMSAGAGPAAAAVAPGESQRLARAKDLIADEQWTRAIQVLRAAAADPKEQGRDEVTYWLAHSLAQAGDSAAALDAIRRLERDYPRSLWVQPAGALRIQLAVRLGRNDVLWWTAVPSPPSPPAAGRVAPAPRPAPPTVGPPPAAPVSPAPGAPATVTPPVPPRPASVWLPEGYRPDIELRVQALGHLINSDADRVIPVLKEIALMPQDPGPASRAVFLLAQSGKPEARATVVQVAKSGPVPVRLAAVRELGRFGGPEASKELLQVYLIGDVELKRQVVKALGERADQPALLTIVRSEKDTDLRTRAIVTLGMAGGHEPLRLLYNPAASAAVKRPIILGLFNARAENDLIQIAERERDRAILAEVYNYLRMLNTPKAREYLQKVRQNR